MQAPQDIVHKYVVIVQELPFSFETTVQLTLPVYILGAIYSFTLSIWQSYKKIVLRHTSVLLIYQVPKTKTSPVNGNTTTTQSVVYVLANNEPRHSCHSLPHTPRGERPTDIHLGSKLTNKELHY